MSHNRDDRFYAIANLELEEEPESARRSKLSGPWFAVFMRADQK
jgi:hypothetical protein